jgi:cobyrinic acid a,c-diamide synthase
MIAAPHSGAGKTTVTLALLSALKRRGLSPVSFKCGPDYIDPMFHRAVLGIRATTSTCSSRRSRPYATCFMRMRRVTARL